MRYTREEVLIEGGRKLYLYTFEDEAVEGEGEQNDGEDTTEPRPDQSADGLRT